MAHFASYIWDRTLAGNLLPTEEPSALAEAMIAAYDGFGTTHDAAMKYDARARFPEVCGSLAAHAVESFRDSRIFSRS